MATATSERPKPIQIIPSQEVYDSISEIADQLRTSRAKLGEIALEFILPKIESGEIELVNGKLQPARNRR